MALPIIGAIVVGGYFIVGQLQSGFMPAIDEGAFVLDYVSPPGSSLQESDRLLRAVDNILRGFEAVSEYRVAIQNHRSLPELSIQVEPAPESASDSSLKHRLEAALTNAFALRIPVSLVPPGSLPRFEMKARRWVNT